MASLRLTIRLKTSDESERLVIDLIEGNFASDSGEVSFTELQREMKGCVNDESRIIVRWQNYVETPFHSYGHGVWDIEVSNCDDDEQV